MATTVWKGHLTFGLVSIPIRLMRAARPEKVNLHQVYRVPRAMSVPEETLPPAERIAAIDSSTSAKNPAARLRSMPSPEEPEPEIELVSRIRQSTIAPVENTPIPRSELLKGYEYAKDQYVVIDPEDIRKITPQTATAMQIVEFVRFAEVDPIYLETSYYMLPDDAGEKAYALLFEGMRETGYVALAQVAMHRREHVMILRPGKTGIITHTMFYADEVRTMQEFRTDTSLVTPKEMVLARSLIETLAVPFEPAKFRDSYRERLRQLIEAKVQGRELTPAAPAPAAKVVDIMDALQKSLAAAVAQKPAKSAGVSTPRQPAKSERTGGKRRSQRGATR